MDRRQFLKGLLATFAATAIARNGVLQPDPERRVFDMGPALAKLDTERWGKEMVSGFVSGVGRKSPLVAGNLQLKISDGWVTLDADGIAFASMSEAMYGSSDQLRRWFNELPSVTWTFRPEDVRVNGHHIHPQPEA